VITKIHNPPTLQTVIRMDIRHTMAISRSA